MSAHILCAHTPVHPWVCAPNSQYVQSMCALHVRSDPLMCAGMCAEIRVATKRHRCMCGRQSVCAQYVRGYVRKSPRGTIVGIMDVVQSAVTIKAPVPAHAHIPCAHTRTHTKRTCPRTCRTHIPGAHTCAHTPAHAFRTYPTHIPKPRCENEGRVLSGLALPVILAKCCSV